jgi:hypothetical protein
VNQVCRLLGISKKTYYRSQAPEERLAEKYQALRPVLDRLIERHPSYGLPRLKKALAEQEGHIVNAKLLRKLLRVWGLNWQRKAGGGQHQPELGAADHWGIGRQSQSGATHPDYSLFSGASYRYDPTALSSRHRLCERPSGLVWQAGLGMGTLSASRYRAGTGFVAASPGRTQAMERRHT